MPPAPTSTPRRPLRAAMLVLLCLFIGTTINLLIAWLPCVRWGAPTFSWDLVIYEPLDRWEHAAGAEQGKPVVMKREHCKFQTIDTAIWDVQTSRVLLGQRRVSVCSTGFPMRSMYSSSDWSSDAPVFIIDGYELQLGPIAGVIPLRPLWPATIINTAIYALAAWLLLILFTQTQKWTRRRRGLCPTCTYDRTGLPPDAPCPECGTPTRPPATPASRPKTSS